MARQAMTMQDKIDRALLGELSNAEQAFFEWIQEKAGPVVLDRTTFILGRQLYTDYTSDPDVAAAIAARRAENDEKKKAREKASIDRAMALLAKMGFSIEPQDSDDDEDEDEDED